MLSPVAFASAVAKSATKVFEGGDLGPSDAYLLAAGLGVPALANPNTQFSQSDTKENAVSGGYSADLPQGISLEPSPELTSVTKKLEDGTEVTHTPLVVPQDAPIHNQILRKVTPSVEEQLASGEGIVVLGARQIGAEQKIIDGKLVTRYGFEQQIADARELKMENIMKLFSRLNKGEEISISDVFFAVISDIFGNLGQILKHTLSPSQIYNALRGTRTVTVDVTSSTISRIDSLGQDEFKKINSEKHELPDTGQIEKTSQLQKIQQVNRTDTDFVSIETSYGAARFDTNNPLSSDHGIALPPRTEKQTFISVNEHHEEMISTKKETVTSRTFLGIDTEKILGGKSESGPVHETRTDASNWKLIEVGDTDVTVALADGKLTTKELSSLKAACTDEQNGETLVRTRVDETTVSSEFKSGYIDYVPLGSLAKMGVKSSYGFEVTTTDYFWAVADVASTIGTAGVGVALKTGAVGVAKGIAKGSVQAAAKAFVQGGKNVITTAAKNVASDIAAPFQLAKDVVNYGSKHGAKELTKKLGQQAVNQGKRIINTFTGKNRFDLDKMQGILSENARKIINSEWAGKIFPLKGKLGIKYPKGVEFTKDGYPKLRPYAKKSVSPKGLTGNYGIDEKLANMKAGYPRTPKGYVWHHHQNGRDMLLVPKDIHQAVRHTGGASLIKAQQAQVERLGRYVYGSADIISKKTLTS